MLFLLIRYIEALRRNEIKVYVHTQRQTFATNEK